MILVEKKQSGGSIFAPSQIDFGVKDFSPIIRGYGDTGRVQQKRGSSSGSRGSSSTGTSAKKGLTSDITYYNTEKTKHMNAIKAGLENDPEGFKSSGQWEMHLQALYKLDTVVNPSLASKYEKYTGNVKDMKTNQFSSAPAVSGGSAVVRNTKTGAYEVVDNDELIKNAEDYSILSIGQLAEQREANPSFHAFDGGLGQVADNIMNNAYGAKQFGEFINAQTLRLGSTETGDFKSNKGQLQTVVNNIITAGPSGANTYAAGKALYQLHNKAKNHMIDVDDMEDDEIGSLIDNETSKFLSNSVSHMLDFKDKRSDDEGKDDGNKTYKTNILYHSIATVGKELFTMENSAGLEGNKTILFTLPGVRVPDTNLINNSYSGGKLYDDKKASTEEKGKTIERNDILTKINNVNNMTLANGVRIGGVSQGGINGVTTPSNAQLYFIIAPIQKTNNGEVVNYSAPGLTNIAKAVEYGKKRLSELHITEEDIRDNRSSEKVQQWVLDVDAFAKKKGNHILENVPNVRLGLAAATEVMYNSTGDGLDGGYTNAIKKSSAEGQSLDERVGDVTRKAVKATAFMPVSSSFWTIAPAYDAFGSSAELTYTKDSKFASIFTKPNVVDKVNTESVINQLAPSGDELTNLFK